jgi:paraquat-inducible protein A
MTDTLVACRACDLLQKLPALAPREHACCTRCGYRVAKRAVNGLDRTLALTLAAIVLLVLANATPLMDLSVVGRSTSATVMRGVVEMWHHDQPITAAIVAFCAILAPGAFLLSMLTVLLAAKRAPVPRWISEILRWTRYLRAWSLLEVMLLGLLVALVKIAQLAHVGADVGIFSVGALTFLFPAIMHYFDPREIWERIEWIAAREPGSLPPVMTRQALRDE